MKIAVTRENPPDTVVEREEVELADTANDFDVSYAIDDVLAVWNLSVGDTIKIREV